MVQWTPEIITEASGINQSQECMFYKAMGLLQLALLTGYMWAVLKAVILVKGV